MAAIVDYCSLASTILLFSLERNPRRVSITFDLLMNKIIVADDCKLDSCNENIIFPCNFEDFIDYISSVCSVDAMSLCNGELKRKTVGKYEPCLQTPLGSGTIISCTKIFNNDTIKLKELIGKKEKILQQKRFLRYLNTLSLIHTSVSFHVNGSCSLTLCDLPSVCLSNSFNFDSRSRGAVSSRFMQITESLPLFTSSESVIKGKIDFITQQKFEPFIVDCEKIKFPTTSVLINGNNVIQKGNEIKIFHSDPIEFSWKRSGSEVDLKGEYSNFEDAFTCGDNVGKELIKNLEFIGIWERKFIIAKSGEILYAIDQHAAHERVNLSRLIKRSEVERHPHELKSPIEIIDSFGFPFESNEAIKALREWGWRFSGKRILVCVPCICGVVIDSIEGMIKYACTVATGTKPVMPNCILDALRTRACKTAIKFGDYIDDRTARQLILCLGESDRPNHCAHGRTVVSPIIDFERPLSKFSGL